MKAFSYQFFAEDEKPLNREVALFKRVQIAPRENSFLISKLTLQNYCIMSIQSGQFDWKFNEKTYHITPEDLILACPGIVMEKNFKPVEKGDFYKISLNPEYYFDQTGEGKPSENRSTERSEISYILSQFGRKGMLFLENNDEVRALFKKLEDEFENAEVGHRVRISALINELIISTYRRFCQNDKNCNGNFTEGQFNKLTEALSTNLSHQWSVKEMADLAKMGITQLSLRMKTQLGYSPFDYLIYLRLNKAVQLLKETEEPITGIALDTGFYSSQHFSNTFKKIMGACPSSFRKSVKGAAVES